jgi:hypothetical protein
MSRRLSRDESLSEFVSWLQYKGQDLPLFSDKLRDDVAKTVETGYDNARPDILSRKDLDDREVPGMTVVLQKLQYLKIKPQR